MPNVERLQSPGSGSTSCLSDINFKFNTRRISYVIWRMPALLVQKKKTEKQTENGNKGKP